jgi:hypothetical protein
MANLERTKPWSFGPITRPSALLCSLLLCLGLSACDKPEEKAEKKVEEESEEDKAVAERLAKKRAEREAAEKAEADKLAMIQSLLVLPEKMPKDLKQACDQAANAQDEFMKRHFDGDALAKWEAAKGTQLGMVKASCAKMQSIEVPACQVHAMDNAPPELKKNLPELLKGCIDKFAAGAGGEAAPPAQ